jgi:hypothetical protein
MLAGASLLFAATPGWAQTQDQIDRRVAAARLSVEPLGVLSIVDERPPQDRADRVYSLTIGTCNFGVRRFGDSTLLPDRVARLERALTEAFGERLAANPIRVIRYDIHANSAVEYGAVAAAAASVYGPTSYSTYQAPVCPREEMTAGWFDRADLVNSNSPMIVDIEVVIGDDTFRINSAASPVRSPFNGVILRRLTPAGIAASLDAMDKAHAELIAEVTKLRETRPD